MKYIGEIPSLNGIRAICILIVIGSHMVNSANFPKELTRSWGYLFDGSTGVTIFFVLSGFLITYLLIQEEEKNGSISLKYFFIRRILRIFPVYYLVLFTYFILQQVNILQFTTTQWISSLTYTKNIFGGSWVDGHLWSLAVEEQFYLIWPVVFKYSSEKTRSIFIFATMLLAPACRIIYYYLKMPDLPYSLLTNIDCLMWGCFGAICLPQFIKFLEKLEFINPILFAIPILFVIYLQKSLLIGLFTVPFSKSVTSFFALLLIISYSNRNSGIIYKFLNLKSVIWLGTLSYSLYIWQQLFFTPALGKLHLLPLNLVLILIVAIASYYLVEKPFLKLKQKFKRYNYAREKAKNFPNRIVVGGEPRRS